MSGTDLAGRKKHWDACGTRHTAAPAHHSTAPATAAVWYGRRPERHQYLCCWCTAPCYPLYPEIVTSTSSVRGRYMMLCYARIRLLLSSLVGVVWCAQGRSIAIVTGNSNVPLHCVPNPHWQAQTNKWHGDRRINSRLLCLVAILAARGPSWDRWG